MDRGDVLAIPLGDVGDHFGLAVVHLPDRYNFHLWLIDEIFASLEACRSAVSKLAEARLVGYRSEIRREVESWGEILGRLEEGVIGEWPRPLYRVMYDVRRGQYVAEWFSKEGRKKRLIRHLEVVDEVTYKSLPDVLNGKVALRLRDRFELGERVHLADPGPVRYDLFIDDDTSADVGAAFRELVADGLEAMDAQAAVRQSLGLFFDDPDTAVMAEAAVVRELLGIGRVDAVPQNSLELLEDACSNGSSWPDRFTEPFRAEAVSQISELARDCRAASGS